MTELINNNGGSFIFILCCIPIVIAGVVTILSSIFDIQNVYEKENKK